MKRSKKIYLLLGILAVICIATFAVNQAEEHKEKIKNSANTIMAVASDSVNSLSWEYKGNKFAFHKGEKWVYDKDADFPVDQDKINELLEPFEEFVAAFIIEDVDDYGQYGLDAPIVTIKLETEDKSYEILLGDYSKMDSQRYVSIGDGNVYLAKKDPLDDYGAQLSDLIDHDEVPSLDDVKGIKFAGRENYDVVYEKGSPAAYNDDDIYFVDYKGQKLPLDDFRVTNYLMNISHMRLTDYVTYKASSEDLQKYGLDKPELTAAIDYTAKNDAGEESTETFILNISRDPAEKAAGEAAAQETAGNGVLAQGSSSPDEAQQEYKKEDEEITAYARVGESPIIYKITKDDYKKIMNASIDSLRHLEVLPAKFASINQIDISLEGKDYTITSDGKGEKRTYYYLDKELKLNDFQNALERLQAEKFTDEKPAKKEEISLTFHLDNENYPEVKIGLYRYDGTYCLAVVDGEPLSLIKRSYVVDLIEAVHAIVL